MASFWNIFVHKHYITNPIVLLPTLGETYTDSGSQNEHQPEPILEIWDNVCCWPERTLCMKKDTSFWKNGPKNLSNLTPYSIPPFSTLFVIYSHLFHNLQIQKGKWKCNNLWCHDFVCINLQTLFSE